MENIIDLPVVLPTSQIQKQAFVTEIKNQIMEGTLNPLEFFRRAKLIEGCMEELKKDPDVFDCAVTERAKWGKEKPVVNGSVVDTGSKTTFDFKACGDKMWEQLKEQIAEREKFLKTIPESGLVITDQDSGEVITLYPPLKKISEFITVKI